MVLLMGVLEDYLRAVPPSREHPLAQTLIPILTSQTGLSTRGYPYLQQTVYLSFRDFVPHILGMGWQTWRCIDYLGGLVESQADEFPEAELMYFGRAKEILRSMLRTAAITAPPDLWLLHHVLSALRESNLYEELGCEKGLVLSTIPAKGFLIDELMVDFNFLVSRGIGQLEEDLFYFSSDKVVQRLLAEIPMAVPGEGVRLSHLWSKAFREPSRFKQWEVLAEVVQRVPCRSFVSQTSWIPTLEDVELGFRLVPLVLGLNSSRVGEILLGPGAYLTTDSLVGSPEVWEGARAILEAAGILVPVRNSEPWRLTCLGERVLKRGSGPFGIIEAYHNYMTCLPDIWRRGKQQVSVSRGTNIAASQLANSRSFEKANDSIDQFCEDTSHPLGVFIEHALGRGEATRQRYERLSAKKQAEDCFFVGADLEDPAIDAAMEEQRLGNLPPWMKFIRSADIGQPGVIVDALASWKIPSYGAFMVVGNGFHEIRNQTDESLSRVFRGYRQAGIIIVFTEESALRIEDILESAWNTYHAGFKYVHERSGQVLRPAEEWDQLRSCGSLRSSWASCAEEAGYLRVEQYCTRSRTIFPYKPQNGRNPAISVNHFLVPRQMAKELGLSN